MPQELANALEGRLTTAIWVSAVIALIIVAIVAVTWWMGRRIARNRSPSHWKMASMHAFSRGDGPMEQPEVSERTPKPGPGSSEEAWGSRLVRDTAQRAATLRDTWDRSYRAARSSEASDDETSQRSLSDVAEELLREQRHTNELLRELLDRLDPRGR